ncbi:MAG: polyprenyl synthetase family protein [Halobacteriovoraceae bacterium]|nr:polyprenyl synthetase family protein [Halobacteriovoraceae bacterium]
MSQTTEFLKHIPVPILSRLKSIDLNVPSVHCHQAINELLQKSVLLGGKRLRPLLTYIFGDFFGVELNKMDVCARAIEMVHAASLAHDDVIDEATLRRGTPSINVQASNKKAVLAGDYLLAAVIGELTREGNLELVKEMAQVIEQLAQGEWLQADLVLSREYSRENIKEIALKKTSSVMTWCSVSAALHAGHRGEVVNYARAFGENLGIAFQLLDDTLDFSGESRKDALLDLKNGQVNAVLFEWLELNPEVKKDFLSGSDIVSQFNENKLDEALSRVQKTAYQHLDECRHLISILQKELAGSRSDKELEKSAKTINFVLNYLGKRTY